MDATDITAPEQEPLTLLGHKPWVKGMRSPNPKGRPRNPKGYKTAFMSDPRLVDIMNKAIELALDGDRLMIRLILDKLLPSIKPAEPDSAESSAPTLTLTLTGTGRDQQTIILPLRETTTVKSRDE